jgi:CRP-like cAMP-binding protein
MNAELLTVHPFGKQFWPEQMSRLAAMASETRFEPGELIFHEGDRSSLFYLLISGNVALEVATPGRAVRVQTLYAGDVLGWSSVAGESNKQFQARALEPVHALAFDGARLRHACEEDYSFGFIFMRAMTMVLADRLRAVRGQLIETYTPVPV